MCDFTSLIQRENVKSLPVCTKKEIDSFLPEKRITIIYLFFQLVVTAGAMCFAGHRSISLSNPKLAKTLIYINSNYKSTNQRFGGVATKNCG